MARVRYLDRAWAAIALCVPAILALSTRIGTADLAYHIRAGHEMLQARSIPRSDTFTFTVAGEPWFDQQWGAQAILALIEGAGGWPALAVSRAALIALTFGLVFLACRARGAQPALSALLSLAGFVVASVTLSMRPQLLALPLFAAGLLLWARRGRSPGWMWAIPVLAFVAANLHGSFVLFPLLPALAWVADRNSDRARRWLWMVAATTIATFATPFGPKVWLYAMDLSTSPLIRRTIEEWQPPRLQSPSGVLLYASVLAAVAVLATRRPPAPLVDLIALAIFVLPALAAIRGMLWWGLVAPVIVAGLVGRREPTTERTDETRIPATVVITTLALVTLVLGVIAVGRDQQELLRDAPSGVTAAIGELPPGTRLLVHQPWASWVIYSVPTVPVFADSRIELFPDSIWQDYADVAFGGFRWAEVLDRHDVEAIAAPSDWATLPIIRDEAAWTVAYEGEDGWLLRRADGT